jgi:predicted DNA-binding transcriptional regulator AlpA
MPRTDLLSTTASAPPVAPSQSTRYLPTRGVAERYGVHINSVLRWLAAGTFPKPDLTINRRHYWDAARLDQHDRGRTLAAASGQS